MSSQRLLRVQGRLRGRELRDPAHVRQHGRCGRGEIHALHGCIAVHRILRAVPAGTEDRTGRDQLPRGQRLRGGRVLCGEGLPDAFLDGFGVQLHRRADAEPRHVRQRVRPQSGDVHQLRGERLPKRGVLRCDGDPLHVDAHHVRACNWWWGV